MAGSILSANFKKKTIFLLALIVQFSSGHEDCKEKVDMYEKLIKDGIEESKNFQLPTDATEFKPNSDAISDTKLYDFVIVGAGTTGSVIAKRLSEINDWSILLLEAGDMPSNFSLIPRMTKYLYNSKYNWNFRSTVQNNSCLGKTDQRCLLPRGKMFGGTSGVGYLVYQRGNRKDYNKWSENGSRGWSYKDVLPYFLMSENCQLDGDPYYHGKGGEWTTKWYNRPNTRLNAFMRAYNELFTCNPIDYHGKDQLGLFYTQFSGTRNIRNNAALRFLKSKPKNLKIKLNSYVTKILINKPTKTAYGVEYASGGKLHRVTVRREVILSAGVINTPQLLMLSGVGPKSILEDLKISAISDLPVGRTLFSHPLYKILVNTNVSSPVKDLRQHIVDYVNMYGHLITANSNYGVGYFQSSKNHDPGYPDIDLIFQTSLMSENDSNISEIDVKYGMKVLLLYLNSKSVGTVCLNSNDPYEYPQINPNMYNEADDLDGMYEGIQVLMKLFNTNAIKLINATIVNRNYEQCKSYTPGSKDYWYCVFKLKSIVTSLSGSCKMGSDSKSSVVNQNGLVHGIKNLRIGDASIIPVPLTGGLTAPCLMIGEKLSNIIKERYQQKTHTNYLVFD